jgi:hypothetical protein
MRRHGSCLSFSWNQLCLSASVTLPQPPPRNWFNFGIQLIQLRERQLQTYLLALLSFECVRFSLDVAAFFDLPQTISYFIALSDVITERQLEAERVPPVASADVELREIPRDVLYVL